MVTRLKDKIKKYFTQVWLIELLIVLIVVPFFCYDISNKEESKLRPIIQSVIFPNDYYEDMLEKDVLELNQVLYSDCSFLDTLNQTNYSTISPDSYVVIENYSNNRINFIFRNKVTANIITNDIDPELEKSYFNGYSSESTSLPGINEINGYIGKKYKGKQVSVVYNNVYKVNPFLMSNPKYVSKTILEENRNQYEEYYYTTSKSYYDKFQFNINYLIVLMLLIIFVFLVKIIFVFIIKRGRVKIRGNFILSIIYVLRYGFKFSHTRRTLILSIVVLMLFFVGYLYFLAVGGYEKNIIVTFFSRYPFKGSFLLMLLPMIGIIYSIKKSIDILLVNEKLKEINKGNLDYEIVERGSSEITELIHNIVQIKNGYRIAVKETLENEKVKTELISNVSHDLRTPLTSIINYVNILGEKDLTEDERKEYLSILEQKSRKLKILIDDLFEMSKINSGKIELKRSRIEIMSLIHQVIGEYSYLYEHKKIEFNIDSSHDEIFMDLDGKMMSRVIENIVINAMKYSLEETRVYVDVQEEIDNVIISFKNIANYKMEFNNNEVFERFVRGDKSRNSNVEGSGLGLAITKSIIELHNGEVKINREGDMFKIYIILPKI